eukprot:PhM_4_TR3496/c1_g1_i1/m.86793
MDNGWAFAGEGYAESVCGAHETLLRCPPLLRYLSSSSPSCGALQNCRFRRATIAHYRQRFPLTEAEKQRYKHVVRSDVLFHHLEHEYGHKFDVNKKSNKVFSTALARYVTGCVPNNNNNNNKIASDLLGFVLEGIHVRVTALLSHIERTCIARWGEDVTLL